MSLLADSEKVVNILIDEIFIKPKFEYKGEKITGTSFNVSEKIAKSIYTFMLSSVFSGNKDFISFLPVKSITAEELYNHAKKMHIDTAKHWSSGPKRHNR